MAEDLTGGLNNTLANIMGVLVGLKQHKQQQQMQKAEVLSNLFNSMGTPQAFKGMQDAFKKAGINIPDMQAPGGQAPAQAPGAASQQWQPNTNDRRADGSMKDGTEPSEEEKIIGPVPQLANTRNEVAAEMGMTLGPNGQPTNVIGGEPLKQYNKEVFQRHGQRLKEHEALIKSTKLQTMKERQQLAAEDKREKARLELEAKKETAAEEKQKRWFAESEKKQAAGFKEREKLADKRDKAAEGRLDKRMSKEKSKLQILYGPNGATKMVPVSSDKEYVPPEGWSLTKPKAEDKAADAAYEALMGKKGKGLKPSGTTKSGKPYYMWPDGQAHYSPPPGK